MLPKHQRLNKEADIIATLRFGKNHFSPLFSVYWRKNQKAALRFGFLVSKKVSTKSHDRNLVKRRLRAAAHELSPFLPAGWDVLIVAKKISIDKEYPLILRALAE